MNHINGFAELLLLGGGLDGTQESYVEAILRASQSLQDTVFAYLEREQQLQQKQQAKAKR